MSIAKYSSINLYYVFIQVGIIAFSDNIDLSIQQFDIVDGILYSGGYGHLMLALKVLIGGSYQLTPGVSGSYEVQLYLSTDKDISTDIDRRVCTFSYKLQKLYNDFFVMNVNQVYC